MRDLHTCGICAGLTLFISHADVELRGPLFKDSPNLGEYSPKWNSFRDD